MFKKTIPFLFLIAFVFTSRLVFGKQPEAGQTVATRPLTAWEEAIEKIEDARERGELSVDEEYEIDFKGKPGEVGSTRMTPLPELATPVCP